MIEEEIGERVVGERGVQCRVLCSCRPQGIYQEMPSVGRLFPSAWSSLVGHRHRCTLSESFGRKRTVGRHRISSGTTLGVSSVPFR